MRLRQRRIRLQDVRHVSLGISLAILGCLETIYEDTGLSAILFFVELPTPQAPARSRPLALLRSTRLVRRHYLH